MEKYELKSAEIRNDYLTDKSPQTIVAERIPGIYP